MVVWEGVGVEVVWEGVGVEWVSAVEWRCCGIGMPFFFKDETFFKAFARGRRRFFFNSFIAGSVV